jgi:hypothetical protein
MVGYIKNQELWPSAAAHKTNDKVLVDNVYRMLVTRANNHPVESGWSKEEPVAFGSLVVERIIKAPLFGHGFEDLVC